MEIFKVARFGNFKIIDLAFYPPVIFFITTYFSFIINSIYFNIENITIAYLYLACPLFFAFFYFITEISLTGKINISAACNYRGVNSDGIYYKTCVIFSCVGAIISIYTIIKYGLMSSESLFLSLRYRHTQLQDSTFMAEYFCLFSLSLSLVNYVRGQYNKSILYGFLYLLYPLSVSERTSILLLACTLLYVMYDNCRLKIRFALVAALLFILISWGIAFSANKLGDRSFLFLIDYFSYGITSFDKNIYKLDSSGCIGMVLGSFSKLFGVNNCDMPIRLDPGEFNVFTHMSPGYMFAGFVGVLTVCSILGVFYGAIFSLRKKYSLLSYYCSIMVYPIVVSFYDFQFNLVTPMYFLIIMLPFFIHKKGVLTFSFRVK